MKFWNRILKKPKGRIDQSEADSPSKVLFEVTNTDGGFSFRLAGVEQSIGGVRQLTSAGIQEMTDKNHDLEHQLGLCERMMQAGDILPYPWERAVILLRKQKRYAEELELCRYAEVWCKKSEAEWDGYRAKHWLSPRLQRCVARISKIEALIEKNH